MDQGEASYVYGLPPPELAATPANAIQLSPLIPGAARLEDVAPDSAGQIVVAAPSGTVERRYVLALALRALRADGVLIALAPKEKGGQRLAAELQAFGCEVHETARRHQRICRAPRPQTLLGAEEAIANGAPRFSEHLGAWTQPGLFSWDRRDPGTETLIQTLPSLSGAGADLGCGSGLLAQAVLQSLAVTRLELFDIDRRAIDAARRNIDDPRAAFRWTDACAVASSAVFDFAVMNPPFHEGLGRQENRGLGQDFIRAGRSMLRRGGVLWMVANRHLPYEGVLAPLFTSVEAKAVVNGFKVLAARA